MQNPGTHPLHLSHKYMCLICSVLCTQGEVGRLLPAAAVHHGQDAEAAEWPGGAGSSPADHPGQHHGQPAVQPACCYPGQACAARQRKQHRLGWGCRLRRAPGEAGTQADSAGSIGLTCLPQGCGPPAAFASPGARLQVPFSSCFWLVLNLV